MNLRKNLTLLWRLCTTIRNWPVYFLNRFGWMEGKKEVHFHTWSGITIVGRPFSIDRAIINEEWLDRCYEPRDAGIPWDWKNCKTILDIGSHIGTFTLYAAAHAPDAHIVAYEPEPSNAEVLRRNISINHLENRVKAVEAAVGAKEGSISFYKTTSSASGGHSMYRYSEESTEITVPMVSLESVFTSNNITQCDFLKMDCEGAEYDALYSLSESRLRSITFIALEYHHFSSDPMHTPGKLRTHLEQHGFRVIEPAKSLFFAYQTPTQG